MYKDIGKITQDNRSRRVCSFNIKIGVKKVNFDSGYFVLQGVAVKHVNNKMLMKWVGPQRVSRVITDQLFELEDVIYPKKSVVTASRTKFFRNKDFEVTEEVRNYLNYQVGEKCIVERFEGVRELDGEIQVKVRYCGFSDVEPAWVRFGIFKEDVPGLLKEYLEEMNSTGSPRQRER